MPYYYYYKGMQAVKLLQQNPPVLNWRCWLTQVVPYNGRKTIVVVVAVVVAVVVVGVVVAVVVVVVAVVVIV